MDGRDIDEDDNDDQVHIMTNGTLVSKSGISLILLIGILIIVCANSTPKSIFFVYFKDDDMDNSPTRSNVDREEASRVSDLKTSEDSDGNSDEEEDDDDEDVAAPPPEGMYDPSDYEYLNVSSDIKDLFGYIVRYTPQTIEIETRFKPFIPEYIPAVGDIDAFLKGIPFMYTTLLH